MACQNILEGFRRIIGLNYFISTVRFVLRLFLQLVLHSYLFEFKGHFFDCCIVVYLILGVISIVLLQFFFVVSVQRHHRAGLACVLIRLFIGLLSFFVDFSLLLIER